MRLLQRLARPGGSTRLGGPAIATTPRRLIVEDTWAQTLIVTGYPRDVSAGWADPLLGYPGRCAVAAHIEPVAPEVAAHRLRRRRARLESAWRHETAHGRVEDVQAGTAAEDAAALAERLATGRGKLFRLALYITVYADTAPELAAETDHLRSLAASLLIDTAPATFRPLAGWISTLPLGTDALGQARSMDTDAVAALLPITSPDLDTAELGQTTVVWGTNTHSAGLVLWDRFTPGIDNHNMVILARSGAGKSYLAKLELLRSLIAGIEAAVIDPEDEYAALAEAVGGTRVAVGTPAGRINPFDLPAPAAEGDGDQEADQGLTRRALFIHTLIATMVGDLDATTAAVLDKAILAAYTGAGITADTRTWARKPPVLADLAHALREQGEAEGARLADRLHPYTHGAYKALFDGPTSLPLAGHLVVCSLRHLPEEASDVGMLLVLDRLWRRITDTAHVRPRLVTVDEAWLLLQNPVAAKYLQRMAKAARKHAAGLTLITQDVGDVLATDMGRAVAANAATQVLLRQAPQNLDAVTSAFQLSHGERQIVAAAPRGDALLLAGHQRVGVHALAAPHEDALITTSPEFTAAPSGRAAGPEEDGA
ncbi:VirB4 family type IV secretion system protein [Streptomonospora wellingtoniae]|uniref:DUF87 domain-containing protein n=1 Tax=Streptomonospora wellingtoniae TaxID=3075544 RepID=A0ABU2KYD1_9ACTN|nr:DUF87 domain-containing protein [Streptomonospora sp. DSM 45055]MDT0304321.1 DUF87 domain-containing protein [Streptomonospora sp. DSM 45055]